MGKIIKDKKGAMKDVDLTDVIEVIKRIGKIISDWKK